MKKVKKLDTRSENSKKPWEPMELKYINKIKDIILQGGGKLSLTGGDPGEGRKQKGGST